MSTIKVDTIATRTGSGNITASNTIDLNGNELILDVDGDTSLTADTDDQIDIRIGGSDVGVIGSTSSRLHIVNGDTGLRIAGDIDQVFPCGTSGADRDNAIDLGSSGVRFKDLYLGGGLYVGGTGAANKLDDYEEGTWTPTAVSNTGTLSSSNGHYTKIGQVVFITAYISYTGASTSASRTYGGLPFPVTNLYAPTSVDFQGASWSNAQGAIYFDGGTSNFVDNHGAIRSGSFQADNNTRFQGFYFTT